MYKKGKHDVGRIQLTEKRIKTFIVRRTFTMNLVNSSACLQLEKKVLPTGFTIVWTHSCRLEINVSHKTCLCDETLAIVLLDARRCKYTCYGHKRSAKKKKKKVLNDGNNLPKSLSCFEKFCSFSVAEINMGHIKLRGQWKAHHDENVTET